jgi:hypothetical protein|tara:strand:- start:1513 stop:1974 length:462 start_codon:yes stop_codon:yes gene_type:complete
MNAWSLLYDELYMNDMDWVSANGGFEYTPESSVDSPDCLVLGNEINLNLDATTKNGFWKYEEDLTMKEVRDYLSGTYKAHYTSQESKTQTLDLIESIGDAEAFCRSNAIKYLSRFGKKNGKSKLDILKAIHYCILLYHFSGLHNDRKDAYETF